ncbi:hypothetical protein IEQ34_020926 [Dendrobium chrysotoxum]|uniref:Uncharacterized protein n=1 Tax=Dendrobium chrysotoxum TaxID=161865 RepID=A0AAV7G2Q0_DENCH|nr:hypothetical protein IEQ34_020926 [Dendrobium chrysotoxum]
MFTITTKKLVFSQQIFGVVLKPLPNPPFCCGASSTGFDRYQNCPSSYTPPKRACRNSSFRAFAACWIGELRVLLALISSSSLSLEFAFDQSSKKPRKGSGLYGVRWIEIFRAIDRVWIVNDFMAIINPSKSSLLHPLSSLLATAASSLSLSGVEQATIEPVLQQASLVSRHLVDRHLRSSEVVNQATNVVKELTVTDSTTAANPRFALTSTRGRASGRFFNTREHGKSNSISNFFVAKKHFAIVALHMDVPVKLINVKMPLPHFDPRTAEMLNPPAPCTTKMLLFPLAPCYGGDVVPPSAPHYGEDGGPKGWIKVRVILSFRSFCDALVFLGSSGVYRFRRD